VLSGNASRRIRPDGLDGGSSRELDTAVASALDVDGPTLIEARIDRSNYAAR
jgi:thiamine pyrophosphate-dependent acetolactate synthase large subunit-like protein